MLRKLFVLFVLSFLVLPSFGQEPNARLILNELSVADGNRYIEFLVIEGGDLRGVEFDDGNFTGQDLVAYTDTTDQNTEVVISSNGDANGRRFKFDTTETSFRCVTPGTIILIYDPLNGAGFSEDTDRYDDCILSLPLNSDKLLVNTNSPTFSNVPLNGTAWENAATATTLVNWNDDLGLDVVSACFYMFLPKAVDKTISYCWGYAGSGGGVYGYNLLDTLFDGNGGVNIDGSFNLNTRIDSLNGVLYLNPTHSDTANFFDSIPESRESATLQYTYSDLSTARTPGTYNTVNGSVTNRELALNNLAKSCGAPWENVTVEVYDANATGVEDICYGDNWSPYFDIISNENDGPFHLGVLEYDITNFDSTVVLHTRDTNLVDASFEANKPAANTERFRLDSLFNPDYVNQPYNIYINSLADTNGCVALFDNTLFASSQVKDTINYDIVGGPGPITVCSGTANQFDINFSYDGPANNPPANFTITFDVSVNGNYKGTYTTNSLNYTFSTAETGTFSITALGDQDCPNMTVDPTETIRLVYNPPIVATNFVETCDANNDNYTVSFDLSGGTAPYSVTENGSNVGVVDYGPDPDKFTGPLVSDGNSYQYLVTDATGCAGQNINIIGQKICQPCDSEAGDMDQNLIVKCEGETIFANTAIGGNSTAPGDAEWYVMHDGAGIGLGAMFQVYKGGSTGPFSFQPGMLFGTTYYISHVVGDDNGENPDLADACLSVSQGTPVVFYEKPAANISGGTKVCVNDPFTVPICFQGSLNLGDVKVVLIDNFDGQTYEFVGAPGTCIDQDFTFSSPGSHELTIQSAAYQGIGGGGQGNICSENTGLLDKVSFVVYDEPQVTILSSGSNIVDFCDPSNAVFDIQVVNPEGGLVKVEIREIAVVGGTMGIDRDTTYRTFTLPAGTFIINAFQEFGELQIPNGYDKNDPSTATYEVVGVTLLKAGAPQCSGTSDGKIEFQRFREPLPTMDIKLANIHSKDTTVCEGTENLEIFFSIQGHGPFSVVFKDETGTVYPAVAVNNQVGADIDGRWQGSYLLPAVTTSHVYSIVTVTDATLENPCVVEPGISVDLTVNELPRVDFRQDQTICSGDSAEFTFVVINSAVDFGQIDVYFRGDNNADPKFLADPTDTYVASGYAPSFKFKVKPNGDVRYGIDKIVDSRVPQCTNETPEAVLDSVKVFVKDLPEHLVFNAEKGEICEGESDNLLVEFAGDSPFTLEMKNSVTGQVTTHTGLAGIDQISVTPGETTVYDVIRVTDGSPLACIDTTSQLQTTVIVNPLPTVVMSALTPEVCESDNIMLNFSVTGQAPITVIFKDDQNNQYQEDNLTPGTHSVVVPNPGVTGDVKFSILVVEDGVNKRCSNSSPSEVTVRILETPEVAMSLVEDNLTVTPFHTQLCEDNTTEVQLDITGAGNIQVFYTIKATSSSQQFQRSILRTAGTYFETVGPLDPAGSPWEVFIDSSRVIGSSKKCLGNDVSTNPKQIIDVVPTPKAVFNTNSVVAICEGTGIELEVDLSGVAPFEIDVEQRDTEGNLITTETFINLQAGIVSLPDENPTDTTIFRIIEVRDGSEVGCVSTTQSQVKVNVLPKPKANFVPNALSNTRFIDTICSGGGADIPIELLGVGNVKVTIQETFSTGGSSTFLYSGGSGSHTIERNLPSVTQITQVDYKITNIEDGTSPTCPNGISTVAFATIYIMPTPTGSIAYQSGSPNEVCEGEAIEIQIKVSGKAPVTFNYKDDLGNPYQFVEPNPSTTAAERTYNVNFTPVVGSTRLDPVSIIGGSGEACPGTVSGTVVYKVNPIPEAIWDAESDVYCEGSTKELVLNLRGNGPFDVVYEDPASVPSQVFLQDVDSGFVVNVQPPIGSTSVTYKITSVVDNSNPACFSQDEVEITLTKVDDLDAVITVPIQCDDTATTYRVEININDGEPGTYTVNGLATTSPFTSAPILSGDPYTFVVADNSGCPDISLTGTHACDCLTAIGDMVTTPEFGRVISICGSDTVDLKTGSMFGGAIVYDIAGQFLDPNDSLMFVISTDEQNPMNGILDVIASNGSDNVKRFTYNDLNNVNYGDTVYFAAIAGNRADLLAGNYTNDPCFDVSESFGVVWFNSSTAGWALDMDDEICKGDTLRVKVDFRDASGNLVDYPSMIEDFDIEFTKTSASLGTQTLVYEDIPSNPFTSVLDTLLEQTTYVLTQFADENNGLCSTIDPARSMITVDILALPNNSFTVEDSTTCVGLEIDFFPFNPTDPNLIYDWNFVVDSSKVSLPRITYPDSGLFDVSYTVTDTVTGCSNDTLKVDFMDIQQNPVVGFTGGIVGVLCINESFDLTDTTSFAPGTFGGREWTLDGAFVSNSSVETFGFDSAGDYRIILTDTTTNGCTGRDTLDLDVSGPEGEIEFSKPEVCLGEQFNVTLVNISSDVIVGDIEIVDEEGNEYSSLSFPHTIVNYPPDGTFRFTVTLSNADGCERVIENEVVVLNPSPEFTVNGQIDSVLVCQNAPVEMLYSGGSIAGLELSWDVNNDGSIEQSNVMSYTHTFTTPGSTEVKLTVEEKHCSNELVHRVIVKPEPEVSIEHDVACMDNQLKIVAFGADNYAWRPSNLFFSTSATGDTATTITLTADPITFFIDASEVVVGSNPELVCEVTEEFTIAPIDIVPPAIVEYDTTLIIGDTSYINVVQYKGDGTVEDRYNFEWTPDVGADGSCLNCGTPKFAPLEETEYTLRIYDDAGCYDERYSYLIMIDPSTTVDVPDAFTPNGDGVNDIIFPFGWGNDQLLEFSIYNRWGVRVFHATDALVGWDGKFEGEPQPVDSYVYVVTMKTYNEGEILKKEGTIRLMR